jgi:hypothetical protein
MNPEVPPESEPAVPASGPAASTLPAGVPRWVFRGDDAALDVLAATIASDPSAPVPWPIAPSGPSMALGDGVLLWRSGRGGGVVAACTVVDEPVASVDPTGAPRVTVDVRIDRAFGRPLAPAELLTTTVLRPLAFLDLHEATELRLTAAQQAALAALVSARDAAAADADPAAAPDDAADAAADRAVTVRVPGPLVPVVEELLARLGADAPAAGTSRGRVGAAAAAPSEASDLQRDQTAALTAAHGSDPFTVDLAAAAWRTGVGTARSRMERLVEVGLVARAGTLRSGAGDGRPSRGRPPVLYRVTAAVPSGAVGRDH